MLGFPEGLAPNCLGGCWQDPVLCGLLAGGGLRVLPCESLQHGTLLHQREVASNTKSRAFVIESQKLTALNVAVFLWLEAVPPGAASLQWRGRQVAVAARRRVSSRHP